MQGSAILAARNVEPVNVEPANVEPVNVEPVNVEQINVKPNQGVQRRAVAAVIAGARQKHRGSKPTAEAWLAGPYAETITHLKNFASGTDTEAHEMAEFALQDSGAEVSTDSAAQLLTSIGFWHEHLPVAWVRLVDLCFELEQGECCCDVISLVL